MRGKYGNISEANCECGYSHRSKLERAVCGVLKLRAFANELEVLEHESHVHLTDAKILYIPDFKVRLLPSGEVGFVEAKGYETDVWRIKRRLWKHYGPGFLEIWQGSHKYPKLTETLYPVQK